MPEIDASRVRLSFCSSTTLGGADEEAATGLAIWSVAVDLLDEEWDGVERSLGSARAVIVDSQCPNPWNACDAESGDLQALAAAVWTRDGELSPEVEEIVEYLGDDVLLLDRIELAPDARGQDLGLLCAAEIIRVLGRGCGVVATQGMPPGARELSQLDRQCGSAALTRHWRRLGLHPISGYEGEGMLVGDLTMNEIFEARDAIRADHDLG